MNFVNMMHSLYMYPLINVPTRFTDNSAKCIDHMWCNMHNVSHSGCFLTDTTDHYLIFTVFDVVTKRVPLRKTIREESASNIQLLLSSLAQISAQYFVGNVHNTLK